MRGKVNKKKMQVMVKGITFIAAIAMGTIMSITASAKTLTVTGSGIRIRAGKNTDSKILGRCYKGDEVELISTEGNWSLIQYDGIKGYMYNDFLSGLENDEDPDIDEINDEDLDETDDTEEEEYDEADASDDEDYDELDSDDEDSEDCDEDSNDGDSEDYDEADFDESDDESDSEDFDDMDVAFVNADDVNLREEPNSDCAILGVYNTGDEVEVLDSEYETWIHVQVDDKTGYIYSRYLGGSDTDSENDDENYDEDYDEESGDDGSEIKSKEEIKDDAITHAYDRIGDKYSTELRNSPGYADCSSFISDAFKSTSGVEIGETTVQQHDMMETYFYDISDLDEAAYGDVVYHFDGDESHCGIYIGDGNVLHCSQKHGGVVITDYSGSDYWEQACDVAGYVEKQMKK